MEHEHNTAHFAEIDSDNVVLRVLAVRNEDILDAKGNEDESIGIAFLQELFGSNWVQTSYNGNFRNQYGSQGCTYDNVNDVFISEKPFPDFILDENYTWIAPTNPPNDGNHYLWSGELSDWEQIPTKDLPPALRDT